MKKTDSKTALLYIFLGVVLLGTGPMFVKYVNINGVLVGFYRFLFAGIMLTFPVLLRKSGSEPRKLTFQGLKWAILGGLIFALNMSLWCSALSYTTASAVTLLDNTAPVWVGLLSWLFLKEKQTWHYWLGLSITIAGAGLMIGWDILRSSSSQTTGNLIGIASGFSYALYILITQKARKYVSSLRYSWIVSICGVVALFIASCLMGLFEQPIPANSLVMIFLMALTSQVIAWVLVNHALGNLPAAGASVALVGQPVVTTLLGIILLHEVPSGLQAFGGLVCLVGIIIVQRALSSESPIIVAE